MTREHPPTPRDHRLEAVAREVLALHRTVDRAVADLDDRLRNLEESHVDTNQEAQSGKK